MSLQTDLLHPELGFHDEGADLTDAQTYAACRAPLGEARALPPFAWRSKTFSELESEKIWTRAWVPIGLLPQIPNPGDLLPFTLGFHGIHVQRGADGGYEARLNRHQHGGCRFVPEQCRTGKQTKCTIASCNYTRDAMVIPALEDGQDAPEMYKFVGINPAKLVPVRSALWGPFVMINLDPEAPDLAEALPADLEGLGAALDAMPGLAHHQWFDFKCNWKSLGAAFLRGAETRRIAHQGTCVALDCTGAEGERLAWLFPNLLLAVHDDHIAVLLLQATGMGDTLCRFSLLTRDGAASEGLVGQWQRRLGATGVEAVKAHDGHAQWGTSSRPETIGAERPVERDPASHAVQQYVIDRVLTDHNLHWQAPIMDALMTQRRGSR